MDADGRSQFNSPKGQVPILTDRPKPLVVGVFSQMSPILMEIDNAICGSHLVKSPLRKIDHRIDRGPFLAETQLNRQKLRFQLWRDDDF